eukprot:CAMPEP_0116142150 /NCGR_PEP_ID=MMETSP0329-20121206/14754_1 /TAXON_ID=697910 /ORGANISM="Pseudo-nitzschia arenysensis, Strain B593" /LENGTH=221 /DNA_ID=CAMNT_0003637365 /DNA_START=28 /DNA_END=693 /DNA_ORIENTATION=+
MTEKDKPEAKENKTPEDYQPSETDAFCELGGFFRGVAVAARVKLPVLKVASAKAVRTIGSNRPLAFASEGAVAGNALMPRWMYYGAWGLSGMAITADITAKTWDAPDNKIWETAGYWTAFHVPASLVVPAWIIHQVVHAAEHSIENHSYAKRIPMRVRPYVPVGAALLSVVPVVPAVDHLAELIMEPTLGDYLGLKFDHHHHREAQGQTIEMAKDGKEKKD